MERLDINWDAFKYYHDGKTDSFEDMCRSLFKATFLDKGAIMQAPPNLAGIEVLPILERDSGDVTPRKRISFQSKFTKDAGCAYSQFKESAETTVSHYAGELDRVYLFNNNNLNTDSKSYKDIEAILAGAGIEAVPISGRVLLDMAAEYKDIARRFFPNKTERYINSNSYSQSESEEQGIQFVKHPIRKLAEGLWVNWKTGVLAASALEALAENIYGEVAVPVNIENGGLPTVLSKGRLRLLSVLVQGEGAVVSWDELCERGLFMHNEIEELRRRMDTGVSFHDGVLKDSMQKSSDDGEMEFAMHGVIGNENLEALLRALLRRAIRIVWNEDGHDITWSEELEGLFQSMFQAVQKWDDGGSQDFVWDEDEEEIWKSAIEVALNRKEDVLVMIIEAALAIIIIRKLCVGIPAIADIIKLAENRKGYRIILKWSGIEGAGSSFPASNGTEAAKKEWKQLRDSNKGNDYGDSIIWLRRHYVGVCEIFEGNISNAGGNIKDESKIFGHYRMAEAYMNAYAKEKDSDQTEVMLDYVEKWYHESRTSAGQKGMEKDGGEKILLLHGQPGDGKTTFCKKAVYAHCFEGWLVDAPHVLHINLNKSKNGGILEENKLNLPQILCIKNAGWKNSFFCDPTELEEGTLVILDGYDELFADLAGDGDANTFAKFCESIRKYIRFFSWNVIITSRTMCIKRELDEKARELGCRVASFAPLMDWQQEMVVDRMIELDRKRGMEDDARKIEVYQTDVLPKLREVERMNEFLSIPILFRMIVKCKFKAEDASITEAELYGKLFHNLMEYRGMTDEKEWKLIKAYESLAGRIFDFNDDVCPFDPALDGEKKELTYLFLTKNERATEKDAADGVGGEELMASGKGGSKEGYLGFLHPSFRQYFLARYLVSSIMKADPNDRTEFMTFFKSLRARRITEALVWQFVRELSEVKGVKGKDPFVSCDPDGPVTATHVKKTRYCLNIKETYEECAAEETECLPEAETEQKRWVAAEIAVFNLTSALAAMEKGCRKGAADGYKDYKNLLWLLRRGDYFGIYLEGGNLADCRLGMAFLGNASMAGADLQRAYFSGANLSGVDFTGADLRGAVLKRANLNNAVLKNARIQGANFSGADMTGADLTGVNPDQVSPEMMKAEYGEDGKKMDKEFAYKDSNTDFEGTKLSNAHLTDARLENANFKKANLSGANLAGAYLAGANLVDADLSSADMKAVTLKDANLAGANLMDAWLIDAHLENAHLEGTLLDRAVLKDTVFIDAHLERAHMENAELIGADLTGAHLEGACMRGAFLDKLIGGEVDSSGEATLKGTHLAGADIYGAYLSDFQRRYASEAGAIGQPVHCLPSAINTAGHIAFGHYRQGKDGELLPLRWRVLKIENNRAFLITEKLIACRAYHQKYEYVTWAECDLRKWLEGDFLVEAFDGEERRRIAANPNENPDNVRYHTKGGCATVDIVFLLSLDEAETLFQSDCDREALATPYAKTKYYQSEYYKKAEKMLIDWWLRSPGQYSYGAAFVKMWGEVGDNGVNVSDDSGFVRPALWINL